MQKRYDLKTLSADQIDALQGHISDSDKHMNQPPKTPDQDSAPRQVLDSLATDATHITLYMDPTSPYKGAYDSICLSGRGRRYTKWLEVGQPGGNIVRIERREDIPSACKYLDLMTSVSEHPDFWVLVINCLGPSLGAITKRNWPTVSSVEGFDLIEFSPWTTEGHLFFLALDYDHVTLGKALLAVRVSIATFALDEKALAAAQALLEYQSAALAASLKFKSKRDIEALFDSSRDNV